MLEMGNTYLPSNDDQFSDWAANFIAYVTQHFADFGLTINDVDALNDLQTPWGVDLAAHKVAQVAAKTATATKDASREAFETRIRSTVGRINSYPTITEAQREAMRLVPPAYSGPGGDLGMQDETPSATIDIGNRLKHVMRIQNQTSSGVQNGRPSGVLGAEVWAKVGMAPADPSEMQLVGFATKSQLSVDYSGADAGKQVYYALRWVTPNGEKGNWSETESATIAA
jgi:hypothetical protein